MMLVLTTSISGKSGEAVWPRTDFRQNEDRNRQVWTVVRLSNASSRNGDDAGHEGLDFQTHRPETETMLDTKDDALLPENQPHFITKVLNLWMAIKRTQLESGTYFCTFTCLHWLPLIEITNLYDNIYQWFDLLGKAGHQVTGFVIMPNHLHLLLHVNDSETTVNKILGNGKRFMAYEIVKRLKAINRTDLLTILSENVSPEERARKKKHRVFEPSSDIKLCFTEKFVIQKLEYIHANPISGKWNLATSAVDYLHSSAAYYELNIDHPLVKIIHYKELKG